MSQHLEELQRILIEGQCRSMQGSYERRNPAKSAVPYLLDARSGLKEYVEIHPDDSKAWRLLSQCEECLLNYSAACCCLEKAMNLSEQRDKKDLKKLALLKECKSEWSELGLTPAQLQELGDHLDKNFRSVDVTIPYIAHKNGSKWSRLEDRSLLSTHFAIEEDTAIAKC